MGGLCEWVANIGHNALKMYVYVHAVIQPHSYVLAWSAETKRGVSPTDIHMLM